MSNKNYKIIILVILLIGTGLRFWDLSNRIVIYADSARDAIFAQAALAEGKIPVIGSFSSSGPFVFGPTYYWFLMIMYTIMPFTSLAPWYGAALLSVITILFLADAGRRTAGNVAGIVTAILAAFSPAQIFRSASLTQHSLVGVSVSIALWAMLIYVKTKSRKWIFLVGLAIGIAISLHYQALSLIVLGGIIVISQIKNSQKILRDGLIYALGIMLPFAPLFYWDIGQGWANFRNLMDFIFIGQYRIFISRRWLSFLTDFLPNVFSEIIGGHQAIIIAVAGLGIPTIWNSVKRRKISKEIIWLSLVLILQITVIRYARVELYEGYLVFLHPLVILMIGWLITQAMNFKLTKFAAYIVLVAIIIGSTAKNKEIISRTNGFVNDLDAAIDTIIESKPNQKFMLYDHLYGSAEFSYALSFLLSRRHLIDSSGTALGVCLWECPKKSGWEIVTLKKGNYYVISDLSATSSSILKPPIWFDVTPHNVLQEVGFWWQQKPLTSPFSIRKFLLGTLLHKNL